MDIPEDTSLEILARLPLKSIARFRSVKKGWKLLIDSDYFRDYFLSLNSSSSISWSIVQMKPQKLTLEIVGHYGCRNLGLSQSPGSLVSFFVETTVKRVLVIACTDGLVLIYVEANDGLPSLYIGNPLFQEWFRIPSPTFFFSVKELRRIKHWLLDAGLVTKIQSGSVVSYKVVWSMTIRKVKLVLFIYSSDTGMWEIRNVTCPRLRSNFSSIQKKSIALNGILHWLSNLTSSIVAYSFYGGYNDGVDNDECRTVHFPGSEKNERFMRSFNTSEGFIVYFNENANGTLFRVWRLVKYTDVVLEAWQLFWEVNLEYLSYKLSSDHFPVVMHPLNSEIIYLWSRNRKILIMFNLRTHVFSIHNEVQAPRYCIDGCVLSFNDCIDYMDKIQDTITLWRGDPSHLFFSQYLLPRWLHRLPCPPPQPA